MSEIISWLTEHSLWFLLAAGTVFSICWLMHFRDELEISPVKVVLFSILHTLYGVLTVKVFAVIETGFDMDSALKYYNNTKKTMKGIGKRGRFGKEGPEQGRKRRNLSYIYDSIRDIQIH